jgi:hypothetical protein
VDENTADYKGYALKCAIVYSTALEPAKIKSIEKKVEKEKERLNGEIKNYQKRLYACAEDAELEIKHIQDSKLLKTSLHNITLTLSIIEQ